MKILILEGIATSGKTTIMNALLKRLPRDLKIRAYSEDFTHEPIKNEPKKLHTDFFMNLVSDAMHAQYDVALFDRLYLTQAYRADVTLAAYADLELMLFVNYVETILLEVPENLIGFRIEEAMQYRNTAWGKYVSTKGSGISEQAEYYAAQQRGLSMLLGESMLSHESFEIIDNDYDWIVDHLERKVLLDL